MKSKLLKLNFTCAILSSLALAAQAQLFDDGNLVVFQVGDGSGSLTSSSAPDYLDQYTTGGTFLNSLAIPSTGFSELVTSGSASSEGQLTLSANDEYLVFAGYNTGVGVTKVASTDSSSVARGIATVDGNGSYSLVATTSSFYNGNNIRGGTSDGNGNFWSAGPTTGTAYMGTGTPAAISSVNSLIVQDLGGNLFFSTAKGTEGIYEISGTPTSGSPTANLIIGVSNPSDFAFNTSMTIAYVANTGGGIERYDFSGGNWTLSYTLDSGTGMNGLAVDFSGSDPVIYATTEDGTKLVEISDTGSGSTADVLASVDGTTKAFRGLSFAPVPEPSTLALAGMGGLFALWQLRRRK
jgi:PEP-CTERM motif